MWFCHLFLFPDSTVGRLRWSLFPSSNVRDWATTTPPRHGASRVAGGGPEILLFTPGEGLEHKIGILFFCSLLLLCSFAAKHRFLFLFGAEGGGERRGQKLFISDNVVGVDVTSMRVIFRRVSCLRRHMSGIECIAVPRKASHHFSKDDDFSALEN